ncbi:transporter substrate-binding domain-containing protein [Permianibacter sp. IMCC34836]|uniref:substrate-binding periplasmic protein n=1 Tax=Permianibacter fluminis TaxID=2738515 RepID=UPI001554306E|nr:transporter substrate-binding domain-containing protein [Permianibacter fluminis]NQD36108.1 transporter substrate-binding domain-containing protein [Permianibacter fluminis]
MRLLQFLILALTISATDAAETRIRYPRQEAVTDSRSDYFLSLLELALAKTRRSHGDYLLEAAAVGMQQDRALDSLIRNRGVEVVWTITSREREQQLRPIRIPLEKGLYGCRVLLIRAGEQARFDAVQSLADLATLVAGQGHDWPDTTILRANGLHVETNSNYASSFQMLALGRFDYFPRGVSEAPAELRQHAELNLALERRLLLYYPSAMYFFVNKDNDALAKRLEAGLRRALADGSFDALFRQHPAMREALSLLNQPDRRLLRLHNPLLPEQTPLADKTLWLAPSQEPKQSISPDNRAAIKKPPIQEPVAEGQYPSG